MAALAQPSLIVAPRCALPENPGGTPIPLGVPGTAEVTPSVQPSGIVRCLTETGGRVSRAAAFRVKIEKLLG